MNRRGRDHLARRRSVVVVCVVAALVVAACGESENPNLGVTIDLIMDQPKDYYGVVAIVSGEVDDIYSTESFTIGGGAFEEEMLVILPPGSEIAGARPGGLPYIEDDVVQVKGMVRPFRAEQIESDFDVDLTTGVEEEFEEDRPVMVAQTVHVTPRRVSTVGDEPITDPSALLEPAQEQLSGRRVHFTDLTVDEVLSDTTVFVRKDEQPLLIVLGPAAASNKPEGLEAGNTISLVGALYPVPDTQTLGQRFGLDEASIEDLRETGLYVRAIELTGRTQAVE